MDPLNEANTDIEQIDIFAEKVLAKFTSIEQIIFGSGSRGKLPLLIRFNIDKKVNSLSDVKVTNMLINQDIICNYKVRINVKFKVAVLIKYDDESFDIITIPDDCPSKIEFRTIFPANYTNSQLLAISKDNIFNLTIDFPFNLFDAPITDRILSDHTFWLNTQIENISADYRFVNDYTNFQNTSDILFDLSIFAKITIRLGIRQDILIHAVPID